MVAKTRSTEAQVNSALEVVLKLSGHGDLCYAQSYAKAGLQMHMTGYALYVQILYVLSNLSGWRGEEARATKTVLRSFKADRE